MAQVPAYLGDKYLDERQQSDGLPRRYGGFGRPQIMGSDHPADWL
jgi:hypothetical protein